MFKAHVPCHAIMMHTCVCMYIIETGHTIHASKCTLQAMVSKIYELAAEHSAMAGKHADTNDQKLGAGASTLTRPLVPRLLPNLKVMRSETKRQLAPVLLSGSIFSPPVVRGIAMHCNPSLGA